MRSLIQRWLFVALLPLGAAALGACSDSQFAEPFVADRVIGFGDESSLVLADGRKYSVNEFTEGTLDCTKNAIWLQDLASNFGKPLSSCPGTSTTPTSLSRAQAGATVDGLRQQVDAHLASDRLGEKDLVTMFVGANDIVTEYGRLAADGESTITARLREAGRQLGLQVNRVAQAGTPVLIVTVHDLGRTPFAAAEEAASPGRAALLSRLTSAFNTAMRLEIINDGRMIGLVDAFDLFSAMTKFPANYGIANVTQPACLDTAALPDCTTLTLAQNEGASVNPATYLWADKLHFGTTGHQYLARVAVARARNNPF
jgi:outer membrane lipase/esterase